MKWVLLGLCLLLAGNGMAQTNLVEREQELVELRTAFWRVAFDHTDSTEYYARTFTDQLLETLQMEGALDFPFDSLSQKINIQTAPGGRFRTFGWEPYPGGSAHYCVTYLQFPGPEGRPQVTELLAGGPEFGDQFRDAVCYRIHLIEGPHYLLQAWGSYGGGHEYDLGLVLQLDGDRPQELPGVFHGDSLLLVRGARADRPRFVYDPTRQVITYPVFVDGLRVDGFLSHNGDSIRLKWDGSQFVPHP